MINWVWRWYAKRMRQIDMEILWPTCKQMAPDLHHAKAAFAVHAFKDWAWLILGEAEIIKAIDKLS